MAKSDIYNIYGVTNFIDGDEFPLPKGFRELEKFSLEQFLGMSPEKFDDTDQDIVTLHLGTFTTKDKAIHAIKELGWEILWQEDTTEDYDVVAMSQPSFDIEEDSDDRMMKHIMIVKTSINELEPEACCFDITDKAEIDEEFDNFLNQVADICDKEDIPVSERCNIFDLSDRMKSND